MNKTLPISLFLLAGILIFGRCELSEWLFSEFTRYKSVWGWIYLIDMTVIALLLHAIQFKNIVLDNISNSIAWFVWSDIAERLFTFNTGFTPEDLIFIIIAIAVICYKTYKWKNIQ